VRLSAGLTEGLSPRQILARLLRAIEQLHLRRRDFAQAVRAAERITWLLPEAPQAYRDLGFLYYRTQSYYRSIQAFESYLRWADKPADADDIVTTQAMVAAELALLN
jgi:regulator of sirC expression with transglutaminase-like and TPR domain